MKGLLHYIVGCLVTAMLTGCIMDDVEPDVKMVDVSVRVSLADAAISRAYTVAETDAEKMNTLRIVIVRGAKDGVVEHNRFIDLKANPVILHGIETFQVIANETKYIYFFVNEKKEDIDFDFEVEEGINFPFDDLKSAKVSREVNDGAVLQMHTPLPMNSMYSLVVEEQDMNKEFWVTRAATKFTYIIDNSENTEEFKLTRLEIKNQAVTEYYMQHNVGGEIPVWNSETNGILQDITSFDAPHQGTTTNHQDYVKDFAAGIQISKGAKVKLDPIYLAETKFFDDNVYKTGGNYYETILSFDGLASFTGQLTELPYQLPRNTHVVVTVKIGDGQVTWEVDVFPYIGVDLHPEFGL